MVHWIQPQNEAIASDSPGQFEVGVGARPSETIWLKLATLASLVFFLFGVRHALDWHHLHTHRAVVTGTITNLEERQLQNRNRYTYHARYSYEVNSFTHRGEEKIPGSYFQELRPGSSVEVLYDQDNPGHSLLKGQESLMSYAPTFMPASLLFLIMLIFTVMALGQERKRKRLLARGKVLEGVVLKAQDRSAKRKQIFFEIEVETPRGRQTLTQLAPTGEPVPAEGSVVRVLFVSEKLFSIL